MKKIIGYIIDIIFILFVAVFTIHLLKKDGGFSEVLKNIREADKLWLIIGGIFVFLFVAGESVIIKYMMKKLGKKIPMFRCLKYSFVGFFYSYITPSSSGGQPAQIYYMKKDGIHLGESSLTLLVIAILYKAVLVVFGLLFYFCCHEFVLNCVGDFMWLFLLGLILNVAYIGLLIFLFFKPYGAKKAAIKMVNFFCKIHLIVPDKKESLYESIDKMCEIYVNGADYIKNHVYTVLNMFIITVIQRMLLFAVTWVVYRSLGLSGAGLISILIIQTMISITAEMLPLPGAAGITETCFITMFTPIFGDVLVRPGMLLSRGLTFYALLIVAAVITLIAHMISKKSKNNGDDFEKIDQSESKEIAK